MTLVCHLRGSIRTKVPVNVVAPASAARWQERVKILAVDHADKAVLDRDIDAAPGGRDHARRGDFGQQLLWSECRNPHQAGRDRAAAGFDPPFAVQQRNLEWPDRARSSAAVAPARASAHNNDIIHGSFSRNQGGGRGPVWHRKSLPQPWRRSGTTRLQRCKDRAIGRGIGQVIRRIRSTVPVAINPAQPAAMACAAPQTPMRVPVAPLSRGGKAIMDPMAATAKSPLPSPSTTVNGQQGSPPARPSRASTRPRSHSRQWPRTATRPDAQLRQDACADHAMPEKPRRLCRPELGGLTRASAREDGPQRVRRISSLQVIGGIDRKTKAGETRAPRSAQSCAARGTECLGRQGCGQRPRPSTPDVAIVEKPQRDRDDADDRDQAAGE